MNGVIETATGYLVRAGMCDFTGQFDPATHAQRTDVPEPAKLYSQKKLPMGASTFHSWTGSEWVELSAPLADLKATRCKEVDARTDELIGMGFQYAGLAFSLSMPAQSYWTNLYQSRALFTAMGAYPMRINSIDDMDAVDLNSETDVETAYQSALGTVKAHLGSGTALKDQVRAATTVTEVLDIEDTR